jgi:type IV secretory pathway TraG/TraD family ATPase VirD4
MEETKESQKFYTLFWIFSFFIVIYDVLHFGALYTDPNSLFVKFLNGIANIPFFRTCLYTKLSSLVALTLIGIGTTSNKFIDVNIPKLIVLPIVSGLILIFSSMLFVQYDSSAMQEIRKATVMQISFSQILYALFSLLGAILFVIGISNITKIVRSNFNNDDWNYDGESFMQERKKIDDPTYINIPTKFVYKRKEYDGWINMNPFRGILVIGTPGSGKSFGIINPVIRQMIEKGFSMCIYDYKYPDLAKIAYYKYLEKANPNVKFKVINLSDIEKSCRVNPIDAKYIQTLADAQETASCLFEAMQKASSESGSAAFFSQSAKNLIACGIYFLARFENGKYSDLPHLVSLITSEYETLFDILYTNAELTELLSAFYSAYKKKAWDQLEGQVGTARVFLSTNATKESYYVFGKSELDLHLSSPNNPTILILASNPDNQDVNSLFYSVVINRISKLVNQKGNIPFGYVIDELPTIYMHKIQDLLATARSNKVSVVMGLQEIPQFKLLYGKDKSENITSIIGNILSGSVRNSETLSWLEKLFGKKKQLNESINVNKKNASITYSEKMDFVIPQGKIATLDTGEMVGIVVKDAPKGKKINKRIETKGVPSIVNCTINLPMDEIAREEANYQPIPPAFKFGNATPEEIKAFLVENMVTIRKEITYIHSTVLKESLI